MSTATATPTRPPASKPKKVNQARVLLSEWTKIRSLRSTSFSLLAAVVFIIGFSVLVPSVIVRTGRLATRAKRWALIPRPVP